MEWTERVIDAYATVFEVQVLIGDALNKIIEDLRKAYQNTDRIEEEYKNEFIIPSIGLGDGDDYRYICIDVDAIMINELVVLQKVLQKNSDLNGISVDEIYNIIIEMIVEEVKYESIINKKLREQQASLRKELEEKSSVYSQNDEIISCLQEIKDSIKGAAERIHEDFNLANKHLNYLSNQ